MIVKNLRLQNFRNYAAQSLDLPPGLIAFIGENGQGKTNLLEAICVLATTKSPLVERDRELIKWHEKSARIFAEVELSGFRKETRRLDYSWRVEGQSIAREMKAGGVPQSAIGAWLGLLQVVSFFPHDLSLITGEPDERRRFLNLEIGKAKPTYFQDVARYRQSLKQRNALLKNLLESRFKNSAPAPDLGTLGEWNKQLVSYGARLLFERAHFFEEIAPLLRDVHTHLAGEDLNFSIRYLPGLSGLRGEFSPEELSKLLTQSLARDEENDRRRGLTNSGPHRDDLQFLLGEMDLRRYGSQGQQRLAVLSLKIALALWVQATTGEPPILLLDDALSELDARRRALLLEYARSFPQSVVTATDEGFIEGASAVFHVKQGRIFNPKTEAENVSQTE